MMKKVLIITSTLFMVACGGDDSEVRFDLRDPIKVDAIAALPNEIALGTDYPIEYRFTNVDTKRASGLVFTNDFPPQFTDITDTCTTRTFLDPNQSCTFQGVFRATSAGPYQIGSSVAYDGGAGLVWKVSTSAIAVRVAANMVTALPTNIATNVAHPIAVRFTNLGTQPAQLNDISVESTNNFITLDDSASDACSRITSLAAGNFCTVRGTAQSSIPSLHNYTLTFNYNNTESSSVSGAAEVTDVPIVGTVTRPVPIHTVVRPATNPTESYPVTFTFTNQNEQFAATDLTYTKAFPLGFTQTEDTCTTMLVAGASCSISGTFSPGVGQYGKFDIRVAASYSGGRTEVLSSPTQVTHFNDFSVTLDADNVTTPHTLFTYEGLTKTPGVTGNPFLNAFLIVDSVQRIYSPLYVNENSFINQSIYNGQLVDTIVNTVTDQNQPLTLKFRANRPLCRIGNNATFANRQLNDRTDCIAQPGERVVTVQLDSSTYNALPAGTHNVIVRMSNQYWLGDFSGPGEFSNQAIVNFSIIK